MQLMIKRLIFSGYNIYYTAFKLVSDRFLDSAEKSDFKSTSDYKDVNVLY